MLHNNPELFEQAVIRASEEMSIEASIIEKDYYVMLVLEEISKCVPTLVFKGGTSLSKCYGIIKRFSEDIDLTIECDAKPTESQRRNLKRNIVSAIETLGLELVNAEEIRSRRDFNKYIVSFPSVFESNTLKQHLQIETMVKIRAYPNRIMSASSFIYDYLLQNDFADVINEYDLKPFELKVQSAERTFIDKIFALADYYLSGKVTEHSRHIYDLYKLLDIVQIDDGLKDLFEAVRIERSPHQICLSAQENIDMEKLLEEIIVKRVYEADYKGITEILLFEQVKYEEVIKALEKIKDSNLF